MQNKKYKYRTRLKHIYFRFKKYNLNKKLSFLTYLKYLNLKTQKSLNYENLNHYYEQNSIKIIEGNSAQSKLQIEFLNKYKAKFLNVLEIGFNAGHSSEIFLRNNKNSKVTSIDIGYWYYGKFGVAFLNKKFPNRLKIIFKDSIFALEDYSTINRYQTFDFIYIDGNHEYEYAYSDIKNCLKFSNTETIIAVDDVVIDEEFRTLSNEGPTRAWKNLIKEGYITEVEVAHFKDINRGVAVGKFNIKTTKHSL